MGVQLKKDSIDLGIVVSDIERSLAFYRDFLGLPYDRSMPMSKTTTLHFLKAGTTAIKLWEVAEPPGAAGTTWPLDAQLGMRYITLTISNLDEVLAGAGDDVQVIMGATQLMPGVRIAMLGDPDGNAVELLEAG
jgi:catechol 2,3-dioxygenase-like lactoylglutathione lyase family enzyme